MDIEVVIFFAFVIAGSVLIYRLNQAEFNRLKRHLHVVEKCPPHKWVRDLGTDSTVCSRCKFIVGVDSKSEDGEE